MRNPLGRFTRPSADASPPFAAGPGSQGRIRRRWRSLSVVLLVAIAALLWTWRPWEQTPCGPGLQAVGSPYVCVGIDLDAGTLQRQDPFQGLEKAAAAQNAKVSGDFVSIVLLQDMTPGGSDSVNPDVQAHNVEGALTAVGQANSAPGASPKVKLLFANFGTNADYYRIAVDRIRQAAGPQHIAAVVGIGQSLANSNAAIKELSDAHIATVGSNVTDDYLGLRNPDGSTKNPDNVVTDFYRVGPTNSDEAAAAVSYIRRHFQNPKVLLVNDTTADDTYAKSLTASFVGRLTPAYQQTYQSPVDPRKPDLMISQFKQIFGTIYLEKPDLVFFAGRGTDLKYFLQAMEESGSLSDRPLPIFAGDEGSNMMGTPLPRGSFRYTVYYTGLAAPDEWAGVSSGSDPALNDRAFESAFTGRAEGFPPGDLADGNAMLMADAVAAAIKAVGLDMPSAGAANLAVQDPGSVGPMMLRLSCGNAVAGVSGFIAVDEQTHNPIDKTMVLIRLGQNGQIAQKEQVWPEGSPLGDYRRGTCG